MNSFVEQFSDVNWDELKNRDIVKNSIPIVLLETIDKTCKVTAHNFDLIINHQYFIRADDLAKKLNYDRNDETIILPCEMISDEKSRLNVWYVIEDAPRHSMKYQFFVTPWEDETRE